MISRGLQNFAPQQEQLSEGDLDCEEELKEKVTLDLVVSHPKIVNRNL